MLTVAEVPNTEREFLPMGPTARNALFIEFEINDTKHSVLVDTGSAISQVPEATCIKYGWQVYKNTKMEPVRVQSVYGDIRSMQRKYVWLHIRLNDVPYKHCVWVAPDDQLSPILIRMDFLMGKPLLFDFQAGILVASEFELCMDPEMARHHSPRQSQDQLQGQKEVQQIKEQEARERLEEAQRRQMQSHVQDCLKDISKKQSHVQFISATPTKTAEEYSGVVSPIIEIEEFDDS